MIYKTFAFDGFDFSVDMALRIGKFDQIQNTYLLFFKLNPSF